jgi:hypothetical protein
MVKQLSFCRNFKSLLDAFQFYQKRLRRFYFLECTFFIFFRFSIFVPSQSHEFAYPGKVITP